MNIHTTKDFHVTTSADIADGASLDLEELAQAQLLESQCRVNAHVPAEVRLAIRASATHATVLVAGGVLPAGTVLDGVLSLVRATP